MLCVPVQGSRSTASAFLRSTRSYVSPSAECLLLFQPVVWTGPVCGLVSFMHSLPVWQQQPVPRAACTCRLGGEWRLLLHQGSQEQKQGIAWSRHSGNARLDLHFQPALLPSLLLVDSLGWPVESPAQVAAQVQSKTPVRLQTLIERHGSQILLSSGDRYGLVSGDTIKLGSLSCQVTFAAAAEPAEADLATQVRACCLETHLYPSGWAVCHRPSALNLPRPSLEAGPRLRD